MKRLISKLDLFDRVSRLVDICAIAMLVIDSPIIEEIKMYLELSNDDINLIRKELAYFFEDNDGQER